MNSKVGVFTEEIQHLIVISILRKSFLLNVIASFSQKCSAAGDNHYSNDYPQQTFLIVINVLSTLPTCLLMLCVKGVLRILMEFWEGQTCRTRAETQRINLGKRNCICTERRFGHINAFFCCMVWKTHFSHKIVDISGCLHTKAL